MARFLSNVQTRIIAPEAAAGDARCCLLNAKQSLGICCFVCRLDDWVLI
jgi:hypothetical protein